MKRQVGSLARLGALLFAVLVTAACSAGGNKAGSSAPGASKAAAPPQLVTVRVGLASANNDIYAPVHMAKAKGLDKKYGVSLDITPYNGGGPEQEALAGGDADIIHYFPVGVATAVKKGIKEKMIATDAYRPSGWWLMTAAKSNIKSVQDLNGKKVGISGKNTTTDYFVLWLADKFGIKFQEVPVGADSYPALLAGSVDAAIMSPPLSFKGIRTGDMRVLFDYGKEMPPNMPDVITASQNIIEKHPEAVSAYLKAVFEANRYMKQNRDESIDFMVNVTKEERPDAEQAYDSVIKNLSDDGSIQKDWLMNSLDLAKPGGVTDLPPIDQLYTTQFTPAK